MKTSIEIHEEANAVARAVGEKYMAEHGEPRYCGFAWVDVNVGRTNSKEAKALASVGFKKSYRPKTMTMWDPAQHRGQSMDCKEVGAQAYAEVLRKYGFKAYMGSRAD